MKPRTNRSLILQCLRRYPVPQTAWQIGNVIKRNPASVSSELCHMRRAGLVIAFETPRDQIVYAPLDTPNAVIRAYHKDGTIELYDCPK